MMSDYAIGERSSSRLALLVYASLAFLWTGPALFDGGTSVCAESAPDTWVHMWVFWRMKYAIFGHDLSYFLTHVLTFPGYYREPIAVFDVLLPWLSVPYQLLFRELATVFNLLDLVGLVFTGMAGYGFCRALAPGGRFVVTHASYSSRIEKLASEVGLTIRYSGRTCDRRVNSFDFFWDWMWIFERRPAVYDLAETGT